MRHFHTAARFIVSLLSNESACILVLAIRHKKKEDGKNDAMVLERTWKSFAECAGWGANRGREGEGGMRLQNSWMLHKDTSLLYM